MADLITPRVLKGFRDFLPEQEALRRDVAGRFESVFRSYGFAPIDTPALELTEILLGKGGGETEKQVYRFTDNGGRDVALRFDLTVPFARFAAEHRAELLLPFKRYHIAKVWRGENTQKGRYREFTQCDIDIIGTASAASDAEILFMMRRALAAAGVERTTIHVNHRGLFNRFLARLGIGEKLVAVLRIVDKIAKLGRAAVESQLAELAGAEYAARILAFIELTGGWDDVLAAMTEMAGGDNPDSQRLAAIARILRDGGVGDGIKLAPSITRGLDYYTGVVFETFLDELPEIGSVCSGGRYDNLTALYTKESLSGVGASVGLDRLFAALESLGRLPHASPYAVCAIACVNEEHFGLYETMAEQIRAAGVRCEVCCEAKKLSAQFMQAEKRGVCFMLIPNAEAPLTKPLTLRNLATRQDAVCSLSEAPALLKR